MYISGRSRASVKAFIESDTAKAMVADPETQTALQEALKSAREFATARRVGDIIDPTLAKQAIGPIWTRRI